MAFNVYVGNYPDTFSERDVSNLFQNFKGVSLRKYCKKDKKCFSFLICTDIDQAVSVIKEMNMKLICGRNLIVRATDTKLQNYIDLLLQYTEKDEDTSSEISSEPLQVYRNKSVYRRRRDIVSPSFSELTSDKEARGSHRTDLYESFQSTSTSTETISEQRFDLEETNNRFQYKDDIHELFQSSCTVSSGYDSLDNSFDVKVNKEIINKQNFDFEESNDHCFRDNFNCYSRNEKRSDSQLGATPFVPLQVLRKEAYKQVENRHQGQHEKYSDFKSFCSKTDGYSGRNIAKYNETKDVSSDVSVSELQFNVEKENDDNSMQYVWVSVTNFPLYTTIHTLYKLFSDYDPIDISMVCNLPRKNKAITEALVCFENKDIADEVILTFDNTVFRGRILLVNDIEDLSILNELLQMSE